jgi:hypothetical protein
VAAYSVAYLADGRDRGATVYWYVWAAWLTPPSGRPWTSPIAAGRVLQSGYSSGVHRADEHAEIEADDAIRARLGPGVETRRIDDSFARAAYREAKGAAPNWRQPRPTKHRYAIPRGFSRPWATPARDFFAAAWRADEEGARELRDRLRGIVPPAEAAPALAVLGLGPGATEADVRRAYRRLALETHPDRGGSAEAFRRITAARDHALATVRAH